MGIRRVVFLPTFLIQHHIYIFSITVRAIRDTSTFNTSPAAKKGKMRKSLHASDRAG